ncbi:hypothetical protein Lalb_Chr03g0038121 [Lupinus albus]|uniref:Uncharacterized protein n=1 Tax=Lupinus albus TaxID=3870 RepID=A0A6A4QUE6_LUPAL|nr:hypothetical protein Lalb_Chr03g0038121 [Lupinus albus]
MACNSSILFNWPLCVSIIIYLRDVESISPTIKTTTSEIVGKLFILSSEFLSTISFNFNF